MSCYKDRDAVRVIIVIDLSPMNVFCFKIRFMQATSDDRPVCARIGFWCFLNSFLECVWKQSKNYWFERQNNMIASWMEINSNIHPTWHNVRKKPLWLQWYLDARCHTYRVIQEESALLWEMIVWVILSKKVHTNMGPILNGYGVMTAWNLE